MRYKFLFLMFLTIQDSFSEEKDPVLEDLQLTNQGVSYEDSEEEKKTNLEEVKEEEVKEEEEEKEEEDIPQKTSNSESFESSQEPQTSLKDKKTEYEKLQPLSTTSESSLKDISNSHESQQIQTLNTLAQKFPNEYKYPLHKLKLEIGSHFKKRPTLKKYILYFKSYEELLQKHPEEKEVYWDFFYFIDSYVRWSQGTSFYDSKISQEALNVLNEMNLKFKEDKDISLHLCSYLMMHHFYTEGLQECEKAIQFHPQNTEPYLLKFKHSQKSQKKDLLFILRKFPKDSHVLHFVGNYFKNQKKYSLSVQYLKKAYETNSQSIDVLIDLADTLFQNENYEEALSFYIRSCELNPTKVRKKFRKSKSFLSQQGLFNLASTYQTHIDTCTFKI